MKNQKKNQNRYFTPGQVILHIPHSSTFIPEHCRPLFYLNEEQLQEELLRMTDTWTDELFGLPEIPEGNRIIFPYSRLVCDVERFRDDRMEEMAKIGMGVCYETTSSLKPLKRVTEGHRKEILALYDRHHAALEKTADRIVGSYGSGLLIDCHSFASRQLPYEAKRDEATGNKKAGGKAGEKIGGMVSGKTGAMAGGKSDGKADRKADGKAGGKTGGKADRKAGRKADGKTDGKAGAMTGGKDIENKNETEIRERPDICIGTDPDFHTPFWLRDFLIEGFERRGYRVAEDDPFSGTMVPMKHYHKDRRLLSVMIEINRRLYIDEDTGRCKERFCKVQADIDDVIRTLW